MGIKEFLEKRNYFNKGAIIGLIFGLLAYLGFLIYDSIFLHEFTYMLQVGFFLVFGLIILVVCSLLFGFIGFLIGLIKKGLWKKFFLIILIIITIILIWKIALRPYGGDEIFCNKDDDCIITSYTYTCCGAPCGGAIINRQALERRKKWREINFLCNFAECFQVNCIDLPRTAVCENNQCQVLNLWELTSVEECEKRDGGAKESCYAYFAEKLKDSRLCDKIQVKYRQECISRVQRPRPAYVIIKK